MKELQELFNLMSSADHRDRLLAEYMQLDERVNALNRMLNGYREGTLNFTPNCSYDLLHTQFVAMMLYLEALKERLRIENITLPGVEHNGECK